MINFNELPNDIKNLIFQNNRAWTSNEIQNNKRKFLEVIDHIEEVAETTVQMYYDQDEEDNVIDNNWGFGNAMIECIVEENMENKFDIQMEIDIDNYYEEQMIGLC
jgi:hypothetical protein